MKFILFQNCSFFFFLLSFFASTLRAKVASSPISIKNLNALHPRDSDKLEHNTGT